MEKLRFRINSGTPMGLKTAKLLNKEEYGILKRKGYATQPYNKAPSAIIKTYTSKYVVCMYISGQWMSMLKPITLTTIKKLRKK